MVGALPRAAAQFPTDGSNVAEFGGEGRGKGRAEALVGQKLAELAQVGNGLRDAREAEQ